MRLGQIGVRRAAVHDAPAIALVHDEAWRLAYRGLIAGAHLEQMIQRRGADWWAKAIRRRTAILVIEVGGRVVGYATVGPTRMRMLPFEGEIYELYMKPEYQGLGFGQHLFRAARAELANFGFQGFAVRVLTDNEPAQRFYARQGGRVVAETTERLGPTETAIQVFGWDG